MSHEDIKPIIRDLTSGPAALIERSEEEWATYISRQIDRIQATRNVAGSDRGELAWMLARDLEAYRQKIEEVEKALRQWRERDTAANGAARFGDTWVTVGPDTKREIHDGVAFVDWLTGAARDLGTDTEHLIRAVFNLNGRNLRITALRELAARLYREREAEATDEDVEEYQQLIEDTFIHTERNETKLQEKPIGKAPKYAQQMEPGQRTGWPRQQEEAS